MDQIIRTNKAFLFLFLFVLLFLLWPLAVITTSLYVYQ